MIRGKMKLFMGDRVIMMDNYFGVHHRQRILCDWMKFISGKTGDFSIQYKPNLEDADRIADSPIPIEMYQTENIFIPPNRKSNVISDWQKSVIAELAGKVPVSLIAEKAEVSVVTVYKFINNDNRDYSPEEKNTKKEIIKSKERIFVRPPSNYTNQDRLQQYFDKTI